MDKSYTLLNLLDELNLKWDYRKRSAIGEIISKRFLELGNIHSLKVTQHDEKGEVKVRIYPPDFVPEMKRIVNECSKKKPKPYPVNEPPVYVIKEQEVKIKRKRIKK